MVEMMKPGSVIVDLAAERGGNCDLTVADERIVSDNGVVVIGYTDFPSRMAAQSSTLYSTNVRHMMTDLTPGKDGQVVHNMEDDVIRGANGHLRRRDHLSAAAAQGAGPSQPPRRRKNRKELTPEEEARERGWRPSRRRPRTRSRFWPSVRRWCSAWVSSRRRVSCSISSSFVLSVFVGFQVIWNVSHSLHTPLMAVTNAISSIIILGALMQVGSSSVLITVLAALGIFNGRREHLRRLPS